MSINPNTKYPGRIVAPTLDYPYGSSKNETSPGAGDGTPYEQARANDIFGFQQALLKSASITPSGSAETALVSEYLQSIVEIASGRAFNYDDSGVADAYVVDVRANQQGPRSYFDGMVVKFTPSAANTGPCTADVSGLGVLDIKFPGGTDDPAANTLNTNSETTLIYRSTPAAHLELQFDAPAFTVGSHTFVNVPDDGTDEILTVAHGLGSDDIDFGFKLVGTDLTLTAFVSGMMVDANGYTVAQHAPRSANPTPSVSALPALGNLAIKVRNNANISAAAQTITVKWWARRRS